jgi:hypothetical protein
VSRSEYQYIDVETFVGDGKAFFARLVSLGWVARMRLQAEGFPLGNRYSGSMHDAWKIVPLLYQLSNRPLLDLVEDYFQGPALYHQADKLMSVACIKSAAAGFRQRLPDYGPEMMADYVTVSRWFEDRSAEGDGKALRNTFLHTEEWTFRMRWWRCSLEFRSMHSVLDGITRISSNQLAGNWSTLGYVRRSAEIACANEVKGVTRERTMIVPASPRPGPLEREVCICARSIEFCAAMRVYQYRTKQTESLLGKLMQRLRDMIGVDDHDLYLRLVNLLTENVYWHECGHIHYDPMELDLQASLVCNAFFYDRYGHAFSELAAESYAIERCADNADQDVRMMLLATYLSDDTKLKDISLCELIKIRSLFERTPSDYLRQFLFDSIARIRRASKEIEKRVKSDGMNRDDHMWLSHVFAEMDRCDSFVAWQAEMEQRVRKEIAEWMNT